MGLEVHSIDAYHLPTKVLKALAHPARLSILNALRDDEECVCHLTALLHHRQAYVSQHLMFLRQVGLIEDRKEGLRVYYRIKDPRVLEVLDTINAMAGVTRRVTRPERVAACSCPRCEAHGQRQGREPLRFKSSARAAPTA